MMPTIDLSRKSLDRLLGKRLTDAQLHDAFVRLGTGVENAEGDLLVVEVNPNRPDLLSEAGMARALAGLLGIRPGLRRYEAKKAKYRVIVDKSLARVRPYTACAVVTGMVFTDERIKAIIAMQEKLHVGFCRNRKKAAIGIYPMERIAWPIRFEARKPADIRFMPLDGSREMTGTQILGAHPTGREFGHLLEGLERYPVFVDAADNILSMPPIINSEMTGKVCEKTRDVFVECSGFDPDVLDKLLGIVVCALADEGGAIHAVEVEYGGAKRVTPSLRTQVMRLDLAYINRRLGTSFKESDARSLLGRMGMACDGKKVVVPPYRVDILHMVDLAEEMVIAFGLDNLQPQRSLAATVGGEHPMSVFKARIATILVGLGLLEASTYDISNVRNQTTRCSVKKNVVLLANALTADYDALRAWMVPSVLEVLRNNRQHDYPQRVFTLGSVFKEDNSSESGVAEASALAVALSHARVDYTEMRQLLECLLRTVGVEFTVEEEEQPWAIPGRCARVLVGNKEVAVIGELHPQAVLAWDLEMPVALMDVSLDALSEAVKNA